MADITKRTAKRIADHLSEGETVDAAMLCEPKGTYGPGMVALAVLPRIVGRRMERHAGATNEETGGLAATFPGKSCVVAITNVRILVVLSNGMTFGEPVLVLDRDELAIGGIERKGLGKRVQFVFGDGSAVLVDAQRGQPFDTFEALLAVPPGEPDGSG